jgi:hypothetical protein
VNQIIREIETHEVCPGGKPRRVFSFAVIAAKGGLAAGAGLSAGSAASGG